ncbi:MAG: DNA polymerase III subunit alpha [Fimbriimonas sp.]
MARPFCHVHNHTEYSLLDGANRIGEMVKRAKELGMESLAISDHGVMFGVMEFYLECKSNAIKPILGVEAYVAPQGIDKRGGRADNEYFHLLLLAKNAEGYRNLCELSTIAALEGYYYKPRIDHDILRRYSKGLIATSTCLGSEVNQQLLEGNYDQAQYTAGMYAEMFGEGNYFIELQDHGLPEQARIKEPLIKIARDLKLPLIATNDAHYLCRKDATPHDVLLCIQTGANVADTNRMKFSTEEFYLKSGDEMAELFPDHPEAIENTLMVAEMCNVEFGKERAPMPAPELPEGITSMQYLREVAEKGLKARLKNPDEAIDRLNFELGVIEKTGFEDYFLLVKEFAQATRDKGIYFGVRGSAAGSLVSFCIGITDVDPVKYDLTFERFLNPERISMPDIDMDFEDARRDEVIQYVTDRFGKERVAQIVTFGTLGAKASIKDSGRVLGYSPQETDRICKTIPNVPGMTIEKAEKELAEFREVIASDPRFKSLVETAKSVEGISRNCGVHAAGVVISREPLVQYLPLYRGNEGQPITAYEMGMLEKMGLLKMDFLGLSNLTVLARCVANIEATHGMRLDIQKIEDGDTKTYEMLGRGETVGVFQLESGGMTRWVTQLKPANIGELAAIVALFRPGPMEHIPQFIDTKFKRRDATYLDERMRPILADTYGVIVYQDQVLKLVQALAGFTLGKADVLRRAMGKKNVEEMTKMQGEFMEGTARNGIHADAADQIWQLLLPFAGYAFNKAHAVCYAILAYQTAYLKANYPVEYMAALLAVYYSKEERVTAFIEECRRMRIQVLPPDVNASYADFTIETTEGGGKGTKRAAKTATDKGVRFGLAAIKGVGEGVVRAIIQEREESGPFQHLDEFCDRLKPHGINRTAVEALVKAGALDGIDSNRRKLLDHVDSALAFADQLQRARAAGQNSLFGEATAEAPGSQWRVLPEGDKPTRSDNLAWEKEVMGIYVSDHPLRGLELEIQRHCSHRCTDALELDEGVQVRLAGVISSVRTIVTKAKGEKMANLVLEDFSGQIGAIAFPSSYARLREVIAKDSVVQITGYVMHREMRGEKSVEIRVEDCKPIQVSLDLGYTGGGGGSGLVSMDIRRATEAQMCRLRDLIQEFPGDYQVELRIIQGSAAVPIYLVRHVTPNPAFLTAVEQIGMGLRVQVVHHDGGSSLDDVA